MVLAPINHAFDLVFISFDNTGELFISSVVHEDSMKKMGIITDHIVSIRGLAQPQSRPFRFDRGEDWVQVWIFILRSAFRFGHSEAPPLQCVFEQRSQRMNQGFPGLLISRDVRQPRA